MGLEFIQKHTKINSPLPLSGIGREEEGAALQSYGSYSRSKC